jgi:hypothetical protein
VGGGVTQQGGPLEEAAMGCGGRRHRGIRCVITGGDPEMRKKEKYSDLVEMRREEARTEEHKTKNGRHKRLAHGVLRSEFNPSKSFISKAKHSDPITGCLEGTRSTHDGASTG